MDLPPIEELRILAAWFEKWYGLDWRRQLCRDAGLTYIFLTNRLLGRCAVSTRFLSKLHDVRATLLFNSRA